MTATTEAHKPSRGCYQRGCQLPECARQNYQYMSRLRLDHHRGQRRRCDAAQTRHHIERLVAGGWTQAQIARAAGLAHRTVGTVMKDATHVSNRTALAILSVPIGPAPTDTRDVDATGTTRRLRALVAIGWPIEQLAPRLGIYPTALGNIARGELAHVRAATADTVALHYQHLTRTPGPSTRSRILARKKGWHGPAVWDGAAIDDPAATPETDQVDELDTKRNDLAAVRRDEIEHLASFNLSIHEIAERLSMAPGYVRDILRDLRTSPQQTRTATERAAA